MTEHVSGSLWDALCRVRDHRRREGQRYPLAGLLLMAVAALLAGRPGMRRLAEEVLSPGFAAAIQIARPPGSPCAASLLKRRWSAPRRCC
jgi:hypothetical protein